MGVLSDYEMLPDVKDIMEKVVDKYPTVFPGFDVGEINVIFTLRKKNKKTLKLRTVKYPEYVWIKKPYIIEVLKDSWDELSQKQKNLWVFKIMLGIPEGGFDKESKLYGKKRPYDYELYAEELSVSGGIPGWFEDDTDAKDPIESKEEKSTPVRKAVKKEDIENIVSDNSESVQAQA